MTVLKNELVNDPNANNGSVNAMPDANLNNKNKTQKVFIETYGCQMNLADSETMGGILAKEGYSSAESMEDADIILINTCAVREKAEERVFGRLTHLQPLKKKNPDLILGITGCMAEHLRETIAERAPNVDLIIGPDAYRRLPDLIGDKSGGQNMDALIDVKLDKAETYEGIPVKRKPGITSHISVQRGCDKFCTFCIVPFTRGRERGVDPKEVIKQAHQSVALGFKEVMLLGQTVNSYKHTDDDGTLTDFSDLLVDLCEIDGLERIRFTSPYPTDFNAKLISTMASQKKICKYLHLPAQSGSNRMLGEMRRQYTRDEFDKLVYDIREAMPDIAMSTDIIVGYPGETEEDFQMTVELLKKTRFDFGFLFKYSERSQTFAARNVEDDIPEAVKKDRLKRIIDVQEKICGEVFPAMIGSTVEVLVDRDSKRNKDQWVGKTDGFKACVFDKKDNGVGPGSLVKVLVKSATSHTLIGEQVFQ